MQTIFQQPLPRFDLNNGFILDDIIPEQDAQNYFLYINQPQVSPFIATGNVPPNVARAKEDLQYWRSLFINRRGFYWAIREIATNGLVGTIGFNNVSALHLKGELSYDLSHHYWGRGLVTRGLAKVIDFAQNALGIVRIQAYTSRGNKKSMKVLERNKFKVEGILRKYEILQGEHQDFVMYSLIK
jgi:ribosomal-protein-alanine N-acetyltransferase